jgi:hypothetical protein
MGACEDMHDSDQYNIGTSSASMKREAYHSRFFAVVQKWYWLQQTDDHFDAIRNPIAWREQRCVINYVPGL